VSFRDIRKDERNQTDWHDESAGFPRGTFIVHKCVTLEQERREWYFRTNRIKAQTLFAREVA